MKYSRPPNKNKLLKSPIKVNTDVKIQEIDLISVYEHNNALLLKFAKQLNFQFNFSKATYN